MSCNSFRQAKGQCSKIAEKWALPTCSPCLQLDFFSNQTTDYARNTGLTLWRGHLRSSNNNWAFFIFFLHPVIWGTKKKMGRCFIWPRIFFHCLKSLGCWPPQLAIQDAQVGMNTPVLSVQRWKVRICNKKPLRVTSCRNFDCKDAGHPSIWKAPAPPGRFIQCLKRVRQVRLAKICQKKRHTGCEPQYFCTYILVSFSHFNSACFTASSTTNDNVWFLSRWLLLAWCFRKWWLSNKWYRITDSYLQIIQSAWKKTKMIR